ncbi:MAG: nitrogen-fixing NifU-like protein [Acidobacteriales bacterium]|nr:nitrogen-fixing NifU-like protein [Terriglobales bacterium]
MYSPAVLDHFEHPRNTGELAEATVCVTTENPACGDIMQLALHLDNGVVKAARFRTRGCVAAIACGSALTELIQGKTLDQAQRINADELRNLLQGLPEASYHASHLAIDALGAALNALKS